MMRSFALALVILCVLSGVSTAKSIRATDSKNLQEMMDTAAYGDSILVPPGTYSRVHLRPGIRLISQAGPEKTTIRSDRGFVIEATDADSLCLVEGFTLDGVKLCESIVNIRESTITLRNCVVKFGWAGIRAWHSHIRAEDLKISDCHNGYFLEESDGEIIGNDIRKCVTAVQLSSSSPRIIRSEITGNSLGIHVREYSDPSIGGSLATMNRIYGNPGGAVKNEAKVKRDGVRTVQPFELNVPYNFWGADCPDTTKFRGPVAYRPWIDQSLKKSVDRCAVASK